MDGPIAPLIFGISRPRGVNRDILAGLEACKRSEAENMRYIRPCRWQIAVSRLGVCRHADGKGLVNLFATSPRFPLLFNLVNPTVLQKEIELRRALLPRGVYRFTELEILWFSTTVTLVNWEIAGGKPATIPLKIFVSKVPELGAERGDLLIRLGGRDYWIAPDWKTLFPQRPVKPLSVILVPENRPFNGDGSLSPNPARFLPGERFQIRFELNYPVVVDRPCPRRKKTGSVSYLKLCPVQTAPSLR